MRTLFTVDPDDREYIKVGWTSNGGVCVWKTTGMHARGRGGAQLQNARTMQERCMIIEKLGGIFYPDPKDCPFLIWINERIYFTPAQQFATCSFFCVASTNSQRWYMVLEQKNFQSQMNIISYRQLPQSFL